MLVAPYRSLEQCFCVSALLYLMLFTLIWGMRQELVERSDVCTDTVFKSSQKEDKLHNDTPPTFSTCFRQGGAVEVAFLIISCCYWEPVKRASVTLSASPFTVLSSVDVFSVYWMLVITLFGLVGSKVFQLAAVLTKAHHGNLSTSLHRSVLLGQEKGDDWAELSHTHPSVSRDSITTCMSRDLQANSVLSFTCKNGPELKRLINELTRIEWNWLKEITLLQFSWIKASFPLFCCH